MKKEVGRLALVENENKSDIAKVDQKLTEILSIQTKSTVEVSADQLETLSNNIAEATKKNMEIAKVTSAIEGLKDHNGKIEKIEESLAIINIILSKIEEVKTASDNISKDVSKLGESFNDVFKDVARNSSQSLDALNKMNTNLGTLVQIFVEIPVPSVTPTVSTKPTQKPAETTTGTRKKDDPKKVVGENNPEVKTRNAVQFADSIALKCDITRIEYERQCKVHVVPTCRIDEKLNSRDPELYLKNLLDIELKDEQFDFAIVSVGSLFT